MKVHNLCIEITGSDSQETGVTYQPSGGLNKGEFPIDSQDTFGLERPEFDITETEWESTSDNEVTSLFSQFQNATTSSELFEALEENFEKIIGSNSLRGINVIDKIMKLKRAVCLVRLITGGRGTGFMITDDLLMTNWHVFETANQAKNAKARFNFERDENNQLLPVTEYLIRPDRFFFSNKELDYAIVAVEGNPGAEWGTISLDRVGNAKVDDDAFIIQHPGGENKQIAMSDNEIKFVGDNFIQYVTDTKPGSSGSPVFDERLNIIALHHRGGNLEIPGTSNGVEYFRNQGVNIKAIKDHIQNNATFNSSDNEIYPTFPIWPW